MELFRCVFISLVVFLSALKVQSTKKVAISYEGPCRNMGDRYLKIDCSATKTSLNDNGQCDARADGESKGTNSTFQILKRDETGNITCIQFTRPSGKKYALKVVNQSRTGQGSAFRVVFETYQGCNVTRFKEFLFVEKKVRIGEEIFFQYKPVMFNNLSMCLGKEISCKSLEKLSLLKNRINVTDKDKRHCAFKQH